MDKDDVVQIHNRIYISRKNESNNATCNNMDGTRDYHTNTWRQRKTNKWCRLYVECKKIKRYKWTYLHNVNEVPGTENKLKVTKWKGEGEEGINWETGTDIYTTADKDD